MRSHPVSSSAAALAAAAAFTLPATAGAAVLAVPAGCYLQNNPLIQGSAQPIPLTASGLTPNSYVSVRLVSAAGQEIGSGTGITPDGNGNGASSVDSWFNDFGKSIVEREQPATVVLKDLSAGVDLATAPITIGRVAIDVETSRGPVTKKRKWKISGLTPFTGSSDYYAFYFKGSKSTKVKGKMKLGKASGTCGYLSVKKPLTPFRKAEKWTVRVQASKSFDKTKPFVGGTIVKY